MACLLASKALAGSIPRIPGAARAAFESDSYGVYCTLLCRSRDGETRRQPRKTLSQRPRLPWMRQRVQQAPHMSRSSEPWQVRPSTGRRHIPPSLPGVKRHLNFGMSCSGTPGWPLLVEPSSIRFAKLATTSYAAEGRAIAPRYLPQPTAAEGTPFFCGGLA